MILSLSPSERSLIFVSYECGAEAGCGVRSGGRAEACEKETCASGGCIGSAILPGLSLVLFGYSRGPRHNMEFDGGPQVTQNLMGRV